MKKRLVFPLFNGLVCALFGGVLGYYIFRIGTGILVGGLVGLGLGLLVELLLGGLGSTSWLYKRRVLLAVLLEIPLAIFVVGPYAFVLVETQPDHHPVCCETPKDYGAASYEDVRIQTGDGVTLAGWYVPPQENPGSVIVLLHGGRADRRGTAWHTSQLIQAGYGVLLYDQRGLGESGGERVSIGWPDSYDLLAALDYLESRPEVDAGCLGAVGLSKGGHIALLAAYQEPGRMKALWLDGIGANRIEDFPPLKNAGEQFATLINAQIFKMADWQQGQPGPPPFVQILAELDRPQMVIVASGLDEFESRASQNYVKVAGANVQFWRIENAWHVGGSMVIPEEYSRRMLEFFQTTLGE